MRRLVPLLVAFLSITALPPSVAAQEEAAGAGGIVLRLARQTPWISPKRPLSLSVVAKNGSQEALGALSLGVTVWAPVRSRSAYELSLQSDPDPPVALHVEVLTFRRVLWPGQSRTFSIRPDLEILEARNETAIYPLKVELRTNDLPVAVLRTPLVFVAQRPKVPLNLAWVFVLHSQILYGPTGAFRSPALERAVLPGGRLAALVEALAGITAGRDRSPVDLVLSPPLLDQLDRMRRGYTVVSRGQARTVPRDRGGAAAARRVLDLLRTTSSSPFVEVSALPFAAPRIPALLQAGLAEDLTVQMERGLDQVAELLGAEPTARLLRPPGSAVDQATLFHLHGLGVRLILLDPEQVERSPEALGFALPPTAALTVGPASSVTALVPDAGVQALITSQGTREDPRLGAQAILGELASIWLERPSVPRGVALMVPEHPALPAGLFRPLLRRIATAPWLAPVKATTLASLFPPAGEPARFRPSPRRGFSADYLSTLLEARREIDVYRSMLVEGGTLPDKLETRVLLTEAGEFTRPFMARFGMALLADVRNRLRSEFAKVRPETSQVVTLTSRTGVIPVGVENGTGYPVRVRVRLVSPRLQFVEGGTREMVLDEASTTLTFGVQARTTGRFPVQVLIESPTGFPISEGQLVVRSTAYNRIALIITVAAALVLLGMSARRLVVRGRP